jgi:hypothetical protein
MALTERPVRSWALAARRLRPTAGGPIKSGGRSQPAALDKPTKTRPHSELRGKKPVNAEAHDFGACELSFTSLDLPPPTAGVHPVADPPRVAGALNQACSTDVRGLLPHRLGPGDGVTPRRARLARIQLLVPTFAAEVRPEFIPIPLTARVGRPQLRHPTSTETRCGQELRQTRHPQRPARQSGPALSQVNSGGGGI